MGRAAVIRVRRLEGVEDGLGFGREGRLADRDGVGEGTGLADEDRQVMPEVGGERSLGRRPRVTRDDRRGCPQLDRRGVRPQPEGGAGLADRHRVAAAVEGDEGLARCPDRMAGARQTELMGQGGRQEKPRVHHQMVVVEGRAELVEPVR